MKWKIYFLAQRNSSRQSKEYAQASRNMFGPKNPQMQLHLSQDHAVLDIDQAILGAVDNQNL